MFIFLWVIVYGYLLFNYVAIVIIHVILCFFNNYKFVAAIWLPRYKPPLDVDEVGII